MNFDRKSDQKLNKITLQKPPEKPPQNQAENTASEQAQNEAQNQSQNQSQNQAEIERIQRSVFPGRNGFPRVSYTWAKLTCIGYKTRPVMLPKYGGGTYNSGESLTTHVKLKCDCGEEFEFPVERWPGAKILKSCAVCGGNRERMGSGASGFGHGSARHEPCSMQNYYLPVPWVMDLHEIRETQGIPLSPAFELTIRELYYHLWRLTGPEERMKIISSNPLLQSLERLRLRKSQRLEPDQTDADPEPGRWY